MLKQFLFSLVTRLIPFLRRIERKLSKKQVPDNPLNLEDLTPNIEDKNFSTNQETYLKALKWGISNAHIRNIALTGAYGTGKSTILNAFKAKNDNFNYLEISLAKFQKLKDEEAYSEDELEASIVQQILYFEEKKKLKDSRFERIHQNKYSVPKVVFLVLWLLAVLSLYFPSMNSPIALFEIEVESWQDSLLKIFFLAGTFILLLSLYKQLSNLKISSLSLKDAELIPKNNKSEFSIINKNIDELLYFFEATDTDVVFIEDIDRFEQAVKILIKLRELNALINKSKDVYQPVTFVYAVKDDLFSFENDKTKFFDLVVPIIPIINYNNSKEMLLEKLQVGFINKGLINTDFIKDISPYIQDMRTLISIINEFKIYYNIKNQADQTFFDANKLFALIIYKNIYTTDFKDLQQKKGLVFSILDHYNKRGLYKSKVEANEAKIEKNQEELRTINREKITTIKELRSIYVYEIIKQYPDVKGFTDKYINTNSILEDKNFSKLDSRNAYIYLTNKQQISFDFSEIEKAVSYTSYWERERRINDFHSPKRAKLIQENTKLQEEITDLDNASLFKLFNGLRDYEKRSYFDKQLNKIIYKDRGGITPDKKEGYELLELLITYGYIAENYIEYISYFHPGSLTQQDNHLKMQIIENKKTGYQVSINNIANLVQDLSLNNFRKKAILIFEVLNYLFNSTLDKNQNNTTKSKRIQKENQAKLNEFIKLLSDHSEQSANFIAAYLPYLVEQDKKEIEAQFYIAITKWKLFWDMISIKEAFNDLKDGILIKLVSLFHVMEERKVLLNLNYQNKLSLAINNYKGFQEKALSHINPQELIETLKALEIKFNDLSAWKKDELFELIYQNNLYEINETNLNSVLNNFGSGQLDATAFKQKNKTYIDQSNSDLLKNYINENIEFYIQNVVLKIPTNTKETLPTIVNLLENTDIKEATKEQLIIQQEFKLDAIQGLDNQLVYWCLNHNKVKADWHILLDLYANLKTEDKEAIFWKNSMDFFNHSENYLELAKNKIHYNFDNDKDVLDLLYSKEEIEAFIQQLSLELINSDVSEESFSTLVAALTITIKDLTLITRENRIKLLIQHKFVGFTTINIRELENKLEEIVLLFNQYEEEFNYPLKGYSFTNEKITQLFESALTNSNKIKLYRYLDASNALDFTDILIPVTLAEFFIQQKYQIYLIESFYQILESKIALKDKLKLLIHDLHHLDPKEISTSLGHLGKPYENIYHFSDDNIDAFYNYKSAIPYSKLNLELLKKLQKQEGFNALRIKHKRKEKIIELSYNNDDA